MSRREESMRSMRSIKSVKSNRSTKSQKTTDSGSTIPDIEIALPAACDKLIPQYPVQVKREMKKDEYMRKFKNMDKGKSKRISIIPFGSLMSDSQVIKTNTKYDDSEVNFDPNAILITALYDNMHNLIELLLSNEPNLQRGLFQVLGYILPSYEKVTKLTVYKSRIDPFILYEISKIVCMTSLSEICLDGSSLPEGNFYVLLDNKNACIKSLSLSRCDINDEMCKEIATRIEFFAPAEASLLLLNLSSNRISDIGAEHLGKALKSNRHLRYLNLTGNRIGDDGTFCILNSLMEFLLTYGETTQKTRSLMEYLNLKRSFISKYCSEFVTLDEPSLIIHKKTKSPQTISSASSEKNKAKKEEFFKEKVAFDDIEARAESVFKETIGPFMNPFASNSVVSKDGECYCLGNLTLCYLNLSYNNLSYRSVNKLLSVLQYQRSLIRPSQTGLLKVVIDGNYLPKTCKEYQLINELTRGARNLQYFAGMSDGRRKSRAARMSIALPSILNLNK